MSITQGLFAFGGSLYAAWKGETGDDRLFYAAFEGTNWHPATPHIPGNSSVGPSLASTGPSSLYAAWKGENGDSDQRLFYALFDGTSWQPQNQIRDFASSIGPALGALNGVLYAAWKGPEGDNQIYWSRLQGSAWDDKKPLTGGVSLIGPSLAVYKGNLYAGWRGGSKDQGLAFAVFNGSGWDPVPSIPGNARGSVGPSLAARGDSLYAAWKGQNEDEGLYYAIFTDGAWSHQNPILGVGSSIGPALAEFGGSLYAMWKGEGDDQSLYYAVFDGTWSQQKTLPGNTGQDAVPAPEPGLTDNSNYFIYSNCNPITGLTVEIVVTEQMVYESTSRGTAKGFSFQLNAFSQIGPNIITGWQQFIYNINTANSPATDFHGQFETWPGQPVIDGVAVSHTDLVNRPGNVVTLPSGGVPVGYKLTISLGTDNKSAVNTATFSVTVPGNPPTQYSKDIKPLHQPLAGSLPQALQGNVTEGDFGPILAFQLTLVGPDGCAVKLSSGAGTITYTAAPSCPLTALSAAPACVHGVTTGETANSVYSSMTAGSGATLARSFWVQ